MTNETLQGNPCHCCGQPPRLLQGEGLGCALMCMECGRGLFSNFRADTYQGAQHLWDNRSQQIQGPMSQGTISAVAMFLLKELNDAHDVLRNLAFVLSAGGYNATQVDAKVFENKIHSGIDMLTAPLLKQIEDLKADKERLLCRVADEVISGFEKDEKIAQNKEAIVAEITIEGCRYEFKKNGMVDITILGSGRGFTRHVNNISLSVQKALEEQLKKEAV